MPMFVSKIIKIYQIIRVVNDKNSADNSADIHITLEL